MRGLALLLAAALCCATGCKKDEAVHTDPKAPAARKIDQIAEFKQQQLPKIVAHGGDLEWDVVALEDGRLAVAAPKGWEAGTLPGSYEPPDSAGLGFGTRYWVSSSCGGTCEPKDWAELPEKRTFDQYRDAARFEILAEETLKAPDGLFMVARSRSAPSKTYIQVVRWKKGAERYLSCSATLADKAARLKDVFAEACKQAQAGFLAP